MSAAVRGLLLAVVTAVALAGCGGAEQGAARPSTSSPTPSATPGAALECPELPRSRPVEGGLPPLTLPCLEDGPALRLSDLRGTPTVLNVWAAWCTECAEEMPHFVDGVRRYGDRVRFLGVHYKAPRAAGLAAQADFGVPFPSVQDTDGDRVVARLGAYAPPQTYFVDARGKVVGRKVGVIRSTAELRELVGRHLGVTG